MVRNEKGFTIIELVTVIVILGILAAVAFPKFQNLSGSAKTAVVNGAIAAFKSAAVITLAKNSGTVPTRASVSGQTTADGVTTKWAAAEMAIGEVTGAYEARIDFGLQVFPFPNRCEPGEVVR